MLQRSLYFFLVLQLYHLDAMFHEYRGIIIDDHYIFSSSDHQSEKSVSVMLLVYHE